MSISLILTFGAFLVVFIVTELCIKRLHLDADLTRKIAHIASGLITFFAAYYLTRWEIVFLGGAFSFLLILTKMLKLMPSIHSVERKTFGEIYFPLVIALSAYLFLPQNLIAFQFGILVLGISDAAASIVGTRWGRHVYMVLGNKKSLEGSLAFFVTTVILLMIFTGGLSFNFLIIAFLLTLVEFFLVYGLDNIALPILAAYLLTLFV